MMKGELSTKKAKEQQDKLWELIYKMKKRTSKKKKGKKFSTKNKKIVVYLIEVAIELYNIKHLKKKELVEPNFEWIRDTDAYNRVLDNVEENIGLEGLTDVKVVNLKSVLKFMNNILSGKRNNKYDAEKEYVEKIITNENLLKSYKVFPRNKSAQTIATIIGDLEYAIFGPLLPSKEQTDHSKKGMPIPSLSELETEEEAEKRQKGQGLKIMTPNQLITRLTILLAQKQARNNSNKLKNEIRQIIYSLYRSRNLSKTIYNHLINTI